MISSKIATIEKYFETIGWFMQNQITTVGHLGSKREDATHIYGGVVVITARGMQCSSETIEEQFPLDGDGVVHTIRG